MTGSELLEQVRIAKRIAWDKGLDVRVGTREVVFHEADYEYLHSDVYLPIADFIQQYGEK